MSFRSISDRPPRAAVIADLAGIIAGGGDGPGAIGLERLGKRREIVEFEYVQSGLAQPPS